MCETGSAGLSGLRAPDPRRVKRNSPSGDGMTVSQNSTPSDGVASRYAGLSPQGRQGAAAVSQPIPVSFFASAASSSLARAIASEASIFLNEGRYP